MPNAGRNERRPSKEEFAREIEVAIRQAGYEGELTRDEEKGLISKADGAGLSVDHLYADLAGADPQRRLDGLAKAARLLVHPARLPESWAETGVQILPALKPRIAVVVEEVRREAGGQALPTVRSELTSHSMLELVVPTELGNLTVHAQALAGWGVSPKDAFDAAARNLATRTSGAWLPGKDAPGVYVAPWHDGLDGARLLLPGIFRGLHLKGRPVVMVPTPSQLFVAGSEDETGLFQLGLLGKRVFDKHRGVFVLRTMRLGADGLSWEDWIPPQGHGAYDPLRLLRAIEEVHDYEEHARAIQQAAKAKGQEAMSLPRLELLQSTLGAQTLTLTTWRAGKPAALPKADAILLKRGEQFLGVAQWDDVARALPGELRPLPGYPTRHFAGGFPEEWQLGGLDLQPWTGPSRP